MFLGKQRQRLTARRRRASRSVPPRWWLVLVLLLEGCSPGRLHVGGRSAGPPSGSPPESGHDAGPTDAARTDAVPPPVRMPPNYGILRQRPGSPGEQISFGRGTYAGGFRFTDRDPHGFGDDGGIVIEAPNGFWVRELVYDAQHPIELDWFETVFEHADVGPVLGRIAWSFAPQFYVRTPSAPMTLYSSYLDFDRGVVGAPEVAGHDIELARSATGWQLASPSADFLRAGFVPGMRVRTSGFETVYNNRIVTLRDGGVTAHTLELEEALHRPEPASPQRRVQVSQVRPLEVFHLLESAAPVVIKQKPVYVNFDEHRWQETQALSGGAIYRTYVPWRVVQLLAEQGSSTVDWGAPSAEVTKVGTWRYDAESKTLAVGLAGPPQEARGRFIVDEAVRDLRAVNWRPVGSELWETTDIERAPAELLGYHPEVGHEVHFGVPTSVKRLEDVDEEWEWFYEGSARKLRARFHAEVDPNGREGLVLFNSRYRHEMWQLAFLNETYIGGPRYNLTLAGTFQRYGDGFRYTGGSWSAGPDTAGYFPIGANELFTRVAAGSRAAFLARVENAYNGPSLQHFEHVALAARTLNSAVGARYCDRVHYGTSEGARSSYQAVNKANFGTGDPTQPLITGYGTRATGGGCCGIGIKQVTGNYIAQYGRGGVGGFGVHFGASREAPFSVLLKDLFKAPGSDGKLHALGNRFPEAGKVDGIQGKTDYDFKLSYLRYTEENTSDPPAAPGTSLIVLEATSDSSSETKVNAGIQVELVDTRHGVNLNRTEDTGDCILAFDEAAFEKRNYCADVSQYTTVYGTTSGEIIARDHDQLGTTSDPLTVGRVSVTSAPRNDYRPRYHAAGVVIENATFPAADPDRIAYEGARISIEDGAGYAEERWAPPPARISAADIRVEQRDRLSVLVSDETDFSAVGFMANRPIRISGSKLNDGTYRVRSHATEGVTKRVIYLSSGDTLRAETGGNSITLFQPNVVNGRLHMTGMRSMKEGKPLIIRSTATESLSFGVTGIGPDGKPQQESSLVLKGRQGTSAKRWKLIHEIAITSGTPAGDLRAGFDAPIVIRNVTFTGSAPQHILHIRNGRYPQVPVYIEMSNVRAPAGSLISADHPENVQLMLDGKRLETFPARPF